jgi:hypothetical protein
VRSTAWFWAASKELLCAAYSASRLHCWVAAAENAVVRDAAGVPNYQALLVLLLQAAWMMSLKNLLCLCADV